MAETDKSFPKLPEANWWKLRDLFKRRVPASVTPSYLASALSMSERSAKANIIFPFRKIGIIDEEGKPTDLAYDWRVVLHKVVPPTGIAKSHTPCSIAAGSYINKGNISCRVGSSVRASGKPVNSSMLKPWAASRIGASSSWARRRLF